MNLFNRIAFATALLAAAPLALADQATLTISGRVLPGTCTLNAAPIALDAVKASDLTPGTDAQIKAGALEFTGCVGVSKAVLSFDGTPADGDAERWKNTAATDPASGVSISLLSGTTGNTYLKDGDTGIDVPVTGATARYDLRAAYHAPTGAALSAGEVSTEIVVTAAYE
ncbi:fimbrial protein [Stenotrophomonas maltophilia]|uniref:Fimbrial protein n=1 Tax=Stenotrophomonas maltophilia TaxID=40324 RepID=A0A6B8J113_STEMA|nr:fimbrial protein [Stenotrophomonas maltophilia]MBH1652267.1 fimbrial protein [Stenotrophomonas maltophilia]QGL99850.1 fimbrial protein [Stenotrophomonas maltophilia]HDS1511315.1 fimbrial protein [Stenotrophomonas maltophilia]